MPVQDELLELALIMVPTLSVSNLTYPTLGLEGKGYCTGRQVFEAQNQVAVSGACSLMKGAAHA